MIKENLGTISIFLLARSKIKLYEIHTPLVLIFPMKTVNEWFFWNKFKRLRVKIKTFKTLQKHVY